MVLGIDLGTSELKLLLLDADHRVVASEAEPLAISRPQPRWSEQRPEDWWLALDAALLRLAARHASALAAVRALGLSGQMHGAVLLDAAGEVLRPAILWNDGRSAAQCTWLEANVPALHSIARNLAMPGFTAPKLLWVRENEPRNFERVACVLLPKDWLRWRPSGERSTDLSDASGTLWLDVGARRWSDELLAACGLTRSQMPALHEGSDRAGRLHADLARRWGMQPGIAIAAGGGDNVASAVGIGAVAPGRGFVSLGTSGVVFVCADRFLPNPRQAVHAFCHALPGRWHQMSVMLSATSALTWAARLTGHASEATLLAAAEGVSFGLLDGFMALDPALRASVADLDLVGGGSRSHYWAQWLASVLGVPLILREGANASAALGAARLAWLADGGAEDDVCRVAPVQFRFEPESQLTQPLRERHQRLRDLYTSTRSLVGSQPHLQ